MRLRSRRARALLSAAALAAVVTGPAVAIAPAASAERVVLDSGRAYELHVPPQVRDDPEAGAGRPAMVVLHGLRMRPEQMAAAAGFDALADRDGVLVAYPAGFRRSFNAGLCCGSAAAHEVDDVAFLEDVVADLRRRGAGRVSVVGFSNGGMMAYRFACARPQLVDTVGVVSGTLEVPRCDGPVRALHLHGTRDSVVPLEGSRWSELLSASLRPVATIEAAAPGSRIAVRLLEGHPHRWPGPGDEVDATRELWAFARMTEPT